jgi:protease-4
MKQFFKFMFASIIGFFISLVLLFFFFLTISYFIVSSVEGNDTITISKNSILKIKLDFEVPERTQLIPVSSYFSIPSLEKTIGLNDIIKSIKKAKDDNKIEGIFIDLDNLIVGGLTKVDALRKALNDFKSSGKFIIAHGNSISEKAFYLASVADSIFITPTGTLEFDGFSMEMSFYKKALDKLEIEPQIFQHGKFKSATEPFKLNQMSDENKEQLKSYLNTVYKNFINNISSSTNKSSEELIDIADNLKITSAEDAVKFGLADSLLYRDGVDSLLKKLVGIAPDKKLKIVSFKKYAKTKKAYHSSNNRIAVIYASGEITSGKGDDNSIGTENIIKAIRKAKKNKRVKAIVMRVNSPGGSPLTSDMIWKEILLVKKTKPFIVSMGDVAASGGYYISCAADSIVAEANTITGSIGVFGIIPNAKKFFNNKLGVTFDRVKTNPNSGMMTYTTPLTNAQRKFIQKEVNDIYVDFAGRVAEGRGMTFEEVDKIAQGRIWSGMQAKEIGLVDELGGMDLAIKIASVKAGIDNYRIIEYPAQKEPFEKIIEMLKSSIGDMIFTSKLPEPLREVAKLSKVFSQTGIQARLPFDFKIN